MDWDSIYRKHSQGVYLYLLNLAGGRQEAEDILQETFIKAIRSEASLREPEKIFSWLLSISRNLFLDKRKKVMRRRTDTVADFTELQTDSVVIDDNPADLAERNDFMSFLREAMAKLSESYRTAFTLGVIQKLSYSEIEGITGWSPSMVKVNVFRARKKIALELQEFQR